jgi:hypothetical protein
LKKAIESYKGGNVEATIEEIHIEIKDLVANEKVTYKLLSDQIEIVDIPGIEDGI